MSRLSGPSAGLAAGSSNGSSSTLYQIQPLEQIASSSSNHDSRQHYVGFTRTCKAQWQKNPRITHPKASNTSSRRPKVVPVVLIPSTSTLDSFDDRGGYSSDSTLSSLSSLDDSESEGEEHQFDTMPSTDGPHDNLGLITTQYNVGDVVYIQSLEQRPHIGILTDVFSVEKDEDDDDDEAVEEEEELTMLCTVRFLHWPQAMSQMTSKRLAGLVDEEHEVFYTHQAPRIGRRRTKNSLRSGQETSDDFEHGPSMLYMTVKEDSILGKVHVHPSLEACQKAQHQPGGSPTHITFNRRRMPVHLYVQRAVDPQLEVFWNIDWASVLQRGKESKRWDLIEGDDEIRRAADAATANAAVQKEDMDVTPRKMMTPQSSSHEMKPLQTPGKKADEWARVLAKEKGISLKRSGDRQDVLQRLEAKRIADLLDTPSNRRRGGGKGQKQAGRKGRKGHATSRSAIAKGSKRASFLDRGEDETDEGTPPLTRSGSEFSDDDDDNSTAITSDDEYEEDEYASELDEDDNASVFDEEDDEDYDMHLGPRTPRKTKRKRQMGHAAAFTTPSKRRKGLIRSPSKALATPSSKARILGKVSFAPTALPARPRPLGTVPAMELAKLTPHARAKRLLHVGATPESLPCRQDQFDEVLACLEDAVEEGLGGCLYVSGVPGTGKTATVREVIRSLQCRAERNEVHPFNFVEINGMKLQDAHDTYGVLWHALTGMRCSNAAALHRLSQHFGARDQQSKVAAQHGLTGVGAGPGRATTVVLMDELDQLVTVRQDVMYNMFNWPNGRDSRLIVVAVANTMDLPERVLQPKVASRLGMTRITFRPYNDHQLVEIVQARLGIKEAQGVAAENTIQPQATTKGCGEIFMPESLVYLAKRVSNVSGDARRMLDVCRRAIDFVQETTASAGAAAATDNEASAPCRAITINDMKRVLDAMVKSGKGAHIAHLALHPKITLVAFLSCVRRRGTAEIDLGTLTATHLSMCRMHGIPAMLPTGIGCTEANDDLGHLASMSRLANQLCAMGLIIAVGSGVASARSGQFARYMLACSEDEVRLALEQDSNASLRSML